MILLEWNVNKRSNKNKQTPNFVIENILNISADIICLVEYLDDFELESQLEDYHIEKSIIDSGNQVLIAVKKSFEPLGIEVIRKTDETNCYNFLHIKLKSFSLSIISVRMLTGKGKKRMDAKKQTPSLKKRLENLKEPFICVGDYNIKDFRMDYWFDKIKMLRVSKPIDLLEETSFFFTDDYFHTINDFVILDHVLCSNEINGSVKYSWDFVDDCEVYPSKQNITLGTYWDIPVSYPDHGMLIADIELPQQPAL